MEYAVRRFARNILLIHLALLAVVLGIVYFASHAIEEGGRQQALEQAKRRQEQLANQTARGIRNFYKTILDDMDLLPRTDDSQAREANPDLIDLAGEGNDFGPGFGGPGFGPPDFGPPPGDGGRPTTRPNRGGPPGRDGRGPGFQPNGRPNTQPTTRGQGSPPPRGGGGGGGRRPQVPVPEEIRRVIGATLARQLEDRVSHLFRLEKSDLIPHALLTEEKLVDYGLEKRPTTSPAGRARRGPWLQKPPTAEPTPVELEIVARNHDWLKSVTAQAVSPFQVFDSGGCNVVALPLGPTGVVVATVPVDKINDEFLSRLKNDEYTGAFLVDEAGVTMASSRSGLMGKDLAAAGDDRVKALLAEFRLDNFQTPGQQSKQLSRPFKLGDAEIEASLVTAAAVDVVPGKRWVLLVASPLSQVDRIVSDLFERVTLWAAFVTLTVTAILVSTSFQLIRSRAKFERARSEVIRKELDRARQIQQAWLPRTAPTSRLLDVAAVNYPAQHISGDFYNWFDLPDGRTAVAIGDVTGHGMSAAFLMATTQLLVRTTLLRVTDPGRCMEEVNRQLCTLVFNGQFVTMQILVLDPQTGVIELATAGHPPPLVAEPDDAGVWTFKPLPIEPQLVLGVEEDTAYETEHAELSPGAMLLLYTDGAADVEAPGGKRFGTDGLRRSLPTPRGASPAWDAKGLLKDLVGAVDKFRGPLALGDDLTFVAVRLKPAPVARRPETAAAAT